MPKLPPSLSPLEAYHLREMDRDLDRVIFPPDVRAFVDTVPWIFAKTYAATWPHEYIRETSENSAMLFKLADHIFTHGIVEPFYGSRRLYHREGGKVYWSMDRDAADTDLINRCDVEQTYELRKLLGTLPPKAR